MRQLYVRVERSGWLARLLLGRYHYEPVEMYEFMDTTPLPILTQALNGLSDPHCREERRNPFNQTGMPRNLTGRDRRRKHE